MYKIRHIELLYNRQPYFNKLVTLTVLNPFFWIFLGFRDDSSVLGFLYQFASKATHKNEAPLSIPETSVISRVLYM